MKKTLVPEEVLGAAQLWKIEKAILDWTFKAVDDLETFKNAMQKAVKETTKKKNIHLSISNNVLQKLKVKAYQNWLPYQTYINSILYKYVNNA